MLGDDIAFAVVDADSATAAIFGDLAADDIDVGRALAVTVQRHDTARLNDKTTHAQIATRNAVAATEIDRGDDVVGFSVWTGGHARMFAACDRVRELGAKVSVFRTFGTALVRAGGIEVEFVGATAWLVGEEGSREEG